ncbi:MAG: hypothetical protein PHT84_05095 [Candidatus Pacebacteria bacterium]|nr:hypothetical protein [Candidatus Paceibacterota bacterium]
MKLLQNIQNGNNWNIGFCDTTPNNLIAKKKLGKVQWMKHPYNDRFFADPFILDVTHSEIIVLVEEYVFDNPPGLIVELVVDKKSKKLKQRHELLRLMTHLSYPAIIRLGDEIYVYPENGASGQLNLYRYDAKNHKLVDPVCILNEAVADATILKRTAGTYWLIATKYPDTLEKSYLYTSDSLKGPFQPYGELPYQSSKSCSRSAGDFFEAFGELYRPAQDCEKSYGGATAIMSINDLEKTEKKTFVVNPVDSKYPLGLHTINFYKDICVIDSLGYFYPRLGKLYASESVRKIRNCIKKILGK